MDELEDFQKLVAQALERLFIAAKDKDEFSYVFALLGLNSGMEDAGWQPISETWQLCQDLSSIANTPLAGHTQVRLLLLLYCQITEANYPYHVLYNMLLCIENATPPKLFNFLQQYKKGVPPSVKTKVKLLSEKAENLGYGDIKNVFDTMFDARIRNAVSHADYILYQDSLRLKHKGNEISAIKLKDVMLLGNKAIIFFETFFQVLQAHKKSYKDGYVIKGRKNNAGGNLSSITILADEHRGLTGFSTSEPLPIW